MIGTDASDLAPCEWLIRKGAYFYRPNKQGYTTIKAEAGRYTEEDARREAAIEPNNMSAVHQDSIPDPKPDRLASLEAENAAFRSKLAELCGKMMVVDARFTTITAEREALREERNILAQAFFWFSKWPEFKPSPEYAEKCQADLDAARALLGGRNG